MRPDLANPFRSIGDRRSSTNPSNHTRNRRLAVLWGACARRDDREVSRMILSADGALHPTSQMPDRLRRRAPQPQ